MHLSNGAADRIDRTAHPLHDVDVVNRVLEERAAPAPSGIDSPRRSVVALDRDELVVAERHGEQPARPRIGEQGAGVHELRGEAQDQPDLVHHPGRFDCVDHPLRNGAIDSERLLAEDGKPSIGRRGDESLVLGRPRRDEHGIDTVQQFVLADGSGADAIGERSGPIDLRIVDGDDAMVGCRMLEEPVVCSADEPGPVEPDANGHVPPSVTSGVRPQM